MQKNREGNSIWDVLPEKQQPANMAGKQLHNSITRGRCVHDTVHDSFKGRFLPQFLLLWGSTCFDCYFFSLQFFGDYGIVQKSSKPIWKGGRRGARGRRSKWKEINILWIFCHISKNHTNPEVCISASFFVPRPSRHWGIHFHSGEKTEPVISNLLGGRGDGFTGSIITCYMERSIMAYE